MAACQTCASAGNFVALNASLFFSIPVHAPRSKLRSGILHTHVERGFSNRETPTLATLVLLARFVRRESKSSRKIPSFPSAISTRPASERSERAKKSGLRSMRRARSLGRFAARAYPLRRKIAGDRQILLIIAFYRTLSRNSQRRYCEKIRLDSGLLAIREHKRSPAV